MLAPMRSTYCWITWAIYTLASIQNAAGENQQPVCLARNWGEVEAGSIQWPFCVETRWDRKPNGEPTTTSQDVKTISREPNAARGSVAATPRSPPGQEADHELDTDSPLDNVNFLSFEDWKKQNLAKAGQSAENVGGNRRAGAAGQDRRRPTGINNALDSFGDDGEIELDFGGFGADASDAAKTATAWGNQVHPGVTEGERASPNIAPEGAADTHGQGVPHADGPRSKDAGTTCKERFNYASFDCAATVLKTNPEAKGSSAVLIENKDSYMLNECRAQNKFLILELCDDILVDTVVLANYEFFSSIFHTFRVSVADRYPAKPDQWKELGIYEARNTREIQAFAVENPLIWARYLRIEFLTHYGNEFYCPLSLIRIHGTTMLEEYKHDGEVNRAEEEEAEAEVTEEAPEPAPEAVTNTTDEPFPVVSPVVRPCDVQISSSNFETCPNFGTTIELILLGLGHLQMSGVQEVPAEHRTPDESSSPAHGPASSPMQAPSTGDNVVAGANVASPEAGDPKASVPTGGNSNFPAESATAVSDANSRDVTSEPDNRSTFVPREEQSAESTRVTATQPPSANPTTQESFFKSVNKRLQMLETNSSLSLQYIEEQSRILRDAFNKVEKRQLAKTSTFLENLNVTVVNELKQFREQHDQVWKSVVLEFEHQRIQYHQEIHSLSTQVGVLADELVFQKRVAVIQSVVVLFCLGLVLFTRGAAGGYIDLPSVQSMVSRSYSLRPSSPLFGSPPGSPGSTRATSSYHRTPGHQRQTSEDSQGESISPTIPYAPPTPTSTESSPGRRDTRGPTSPALGDTQSIAQVAPPLLRSNSSPADLKGENEDDAEELESGSECSGSDGVDQGT